jgi:hypothetical protein
MRIFSEGTLREFDRMTNEIFPKKKIESGQHSPTNNRHIDKRVKPGWLRRLVTPIVIVSLATYGMHKYNAHI